MTDDLRFAVLAVSDAMGGGGDTFLDQLDAWNLRPEIVITDDPFCFPGRSFRNWIRTLKQVARQFRDRRGFRQRYYPYFRARQLGIETFPAQLVSSDACAERLRELDLDYAFIFTFHTILKEPVFSAPRNGTINFHSSVLPEHRGSTPSFWSIRNGADHAGFTFHFVDAGIDTGPIIRTHQVPLTGLEDSETFQRHLHSMAARELTRLVARLKLGEPVELEEKGSTRGSYEQGARGTDLYIDSSMHGDEVLRLVSASSRYGGAIVTDGAEKLRVHDAIPLQRPPANFQMEGIATRDGDDNLFYRTADGALIYLVTRAA